MCRSSHSAYTFHLLHFAFLKKPLNIQIKHVPFDVWLIVFQLCTFSVGILFASSPILGRGLARDDVLFAFYKCSGCSHFDGRNDYLRLIFNRPLRRLVVFLRRLLVVLFNACSILINMEQTATNKPFTPQHR